MKNWRDKFKANDKIPINRLRDYVKCEKCGYTLPMTDKEKGFCKFCGMYIFKDKKDEFKYRMERLK